MDCWVEQSHLAWKVIFCLMLADGGHTTCADAQVSTDSKYGVNANSGRSMVAIPFNEISSGALLATICSVDVKSLSRPERVPNC